MLLLLPLLLKIDVAAIIGVVVVGLCVLAAAVL